MLFLQPIFLQPKCEMEFVAFYSTVVLSHMPHIGKYLDVQNVRMINETRLGRLVTKVHW